MGFWSSLLGPLIGGLATVATGGLLAPVAGIISSGVSAAVPGGDTPPPAATPAAAPSASFGDLAAKSIASTVGSGVSSLVSPAPSFSSVAQGVKPTPTIGLQQAPQRRSAEQDNVSYIRSL